MTTERRKLWNQADSYQLRAMQQLEAMGFEFLVHFGTENAVDRLVALNAAADDGNLYEHLRIDLGIIAQ